MPLTVVWTYDYADGARYRHPTALTAVNGAYSLGGGLPPVGALLGLVGINPANYLVNPNSQHNPNYRFSYGGTITSPDYPDAAMNAPFNSNRTVGFSQNLDLDVGSVHVKSITAYRASDTGNAEDLDGMPVEYYQFLSNYIEHQFSQELQISGKVDKFDWIGGAYYFQEGGSERSDSQAFGFLTPVLNGFGVPEPPQPIDRDYSTFEARSIAFFGQTNYHITDTVRFTLGYRYTWDARGIDQSGRNDIYGANVCAVGVTVGTPLAAYPYPCQNSYNANFSYPAWTAGLDWEVMSDTFLYLKTDKAFMAGGFNTRPVPPTVNPAFQPESNMDVEGGLKSDMLDHHLRTNVAIFHAWQSDVQRIVNSVVIENGVPTGTQYVQNAGKTRTYGLELEVTALPWTGMEITASGAYLHAAYVPGTFFETQLLPDGTAVRVDRSDETVPQAPRFTASIGATQTFQVPIGQVSAHLDYAWRDKLVYTVDTASPLQPAAVQAVYALQNELGVIPSYGLLDGRLALNLDNPNVEIALWGKNLTNEEYYQQQFDIYQGLGLAEDFQGDPRTFGVTFTYRFKH